MSTVFKRKDQLKFANVIVGCHDFICNCNEPAVHSVKELIKLIKPELTTKQQEEIQQCLGTTAEDTTAAGGIDDIDIGDLEKLFADDDETTTG